MSLRCLYLIVLIHLTNSFTIPDYSFIYKKPPDYSIIRTEFADNDVIDTEFKQLTWQRILLISAVVTFIFCILCCYCLRHIIVRFIMNRSLSKENNEQLMIIHHAIPMKNINAQYLNIPELFQTNNHH